MDASGGSAESTCACRTGDATASHAAARRKTDPGRNDRSRRAE
jgi:hypothetical protein